MDQSLLFAPIRELAHKIREGETSSLSVMESLLERINRLNPQVQAYLTVSQERSLEAAQQKDREMRAGKNSGPLHGVPLALKDNIETKGLRTTNGAKRLHDHIPSADATIVKKLKKAGAIIFGKLNMHEIALGGTTDNPHYGFTRNPWDSSRIPGGSSGGSASAVAAGMCPASFGTDTAGSIRIPAALCGIVGLKSTLGRVSRSGVFLLSWSMDCVGPITRTVRDAALLLEVIGGFDPKDPVTSRKRLPRYTEELEAGIKGIRVGVCKEYFSDLVEPDVHRAFQGAMTEISRLGIDVVELPLNLERAHVSAAHEIILASEAATYYEPHLRAGIGDFGPDVRLRLQRGLAIPAVHYLKAQQVRTVIQQRFRDLFDQIDVMASPTVAVPAPLRGQQNVSAGGIQRSLREALVSLTLPVNLVGFPAITVPCGFSSEGLPLGLQLVGRPFDEATLLRVAHGFESATPWKDQRPPL
ncbi:MAG TPA: amidase [bacterium]|nr:amidase [bacterium]